MWKSGGGSRFCDTRLETSLVGMSSLLGCCFVASVVASVAAAVAAADDHEYGGADGSCKPLRCFTPNTHAASPLGFNLH